MSLQCSTRTLAGFEEAAYWRQGKGDGGKVKRKGREGRKGGSINGRRIQERRKEGKPEQVFCLSPPNKILDPPKAILIKESNILKAVAVCAI